MNCTFRGSFVALPTPFRDDEIDFEALDRLVDFHLAMKTDGLVVAGTTGETSTLSEFERRSITEAVIERAAGRVPVIAGIGTNSTRTTIELACFAQAAGADGLLAVTPYYNKPTQRGLIAHFSELAEAVETPIVLYNVPSRTGVDLKPDTVAEIRASNPNVVAIKEASGSIGRANEISARSDIALIAGEDALIADFMAIGGVGVIGVINNIAPKAVAELCRVAVPGGDAMRTAELAAYLAPLVRDLFIETNPVPVKTALEIMKLCSSEVRLPLVALEAANRERLIATLHEANLC